MNLLRLRELGAEVTEPLKPAAVRPKAEGYMYEGYAKARLNDVEFHLMLYWHGPEERPQQKVFEKHCYVKGIIVDGVYYDCHWYCVWVGDVCWLHSKGWFGFENEKVKLRKAAEEFRRLGASDNKLTELGFRRIL